MGVRQRSTLTVDLVGDGNRGKARVGEPVVLNFSKPHQGERHDRHYEQHHRRIAYLRWATGFRSVFSWTAAHCCSCLLSQSAHGQTDGGDWPRGPERSMPVTGDHTLQKIPELLEAAAEPEEHVRPAGDESSDTEAETPESNEHFLTVEELEDYVPEEGETFGREQVIDRDGPSPDEMRRRADEDDTVEISVIQTTLKTPPNRQCHQQHQHYNNHQYGRYRDVFYRHGVVTSTASFVLEGGEMKSSLVPRASLLGGRVFTSRADLFVSSGGPATSVKEARGEINIGSRPWVCVSA